MADTSCAEKTGAEKTGADPHPAATADGNEADEAPGDSTPATGGEPQNRAAPRRGGQDELADGGVARWARAKRQITSGLSWSRFVTGVVVAVLCGTLAFGSLAYAKTRDELEQVRQSEADRKAAAQVAKDYALKSLNYSYKDPDGFLASVEDGVAPALKEKYTNVADLLKNIMLQAKVESTGDILAADTAPQPGGAYQVVVSASQTTKNLQNPQPRVSTIVLEVVVNKIGNGWQISSIGPKGGSKPLPGDEAPPAPADAATGATAQPRQNAGTADHMGR